MELKATSPVSGCRVGNGYGFSIPVRNKHCLLLLIIQGTREGMTDQGLGVTCLLSDLSFLEFN